MHLKWFFDILVYTSTTQILSHSIYVHRKDKDHLNQLSLGALVPNLVCYLLESNMIWNLIRQQKREEIERIILIWILSLQLCKIAASRGCISDYQDAASTK